MTSSDIAARFASDTANHVMTVLHDDGLYRHLRFANPDRGSFGPFELITWPYNLVVKTGWTFHFDIDATPNMLDLFRNTAFTGEINPSYWQEKVRAGRDEIEGFDPDLFEQQVKRHVVEAIRSGDAPRGIGAEVTREIFEWGDISHEAGARRALEDFRFQEWTFGETWEWNFRDYTLGFLHSCHAIRHGVDLWDAARCDVTFVGGGQCTKAAGHRTDKNQDVHTPPAGALNIVATAAGDEKVHQMVRDAAASNSRICQHCSRPCNRPSADSEQWTHDDGASGHTAEPYPLPQIPTGATS